MTNIFIDSFDPFQVNIPLDELFTGDVHVILPPMRVNLLGLLVNSIYTECRPLTMVVSLGDATMTGVEMVEFLTQSKSELKQVYDIASDRLLNAKPLLGSL